VSPAHLVVLLPTALYVAGLLWFLVGARRRPVCDANADGSDLVDDGVAVVVAARDEGDNVETCLRDLGAQDLPAQRLDIVLVDDASTDGTAALARAVAAELRAAGARIRIVDGPGTGKKDALAAGIAQTQAEIVLTTDADCRLPAGWARSMAACLTPPQAGAVVGFSQIGAPGATLTALGSWEGLDFLQLMTAAAGSCAFGHPMAASGQSLGFRRAAYDEVGGYASVRHRVSGDDVLLLQLIRRTRRWRIPFCGDAEARVVHPPSPSLASFLSRRARWASNAPLQLRLDPLFFLYMATTAAAAGGLAAGGVLAAAGHLSWSVPLLAWGTKAAAESLLAVVGARRFGRTDLLRALPAWLLLQPLYVLGVGLVGPFGFFRWKGRRVALGRRLTGALH
jgi:cellulose synthase/poly-beta-1,6-N-acetylglucosamine synthase-like glycosyltransferase